MKKLINILQFFLIIILTVQNSAGNGLGKPSKNLIPKEEIDKILSRSDSLMTIGAFKQNNEELSILIKKAYNSADYWGQSLNPVFTKLVASYGGEGQIPLVKKTLKTQIKWVKKYGGTALDLGKLFHNYGQINLLEKKYKIAIQAFKIALIFKKFNLPNDLKTTIITYKELAYTYDRSFNHKLSNKYYQTSLALIKKLNVADSYLESSIIEKYTSLLYSYDDFETIKSLLYHSIKLPFENEFLKNESLLYCYTNLIDHVFIPTKDSKGTQKYIALSKHILNKHPKFRPQFKNNIDLYDAISEFQESNYAYSLKIFQKVIDPLIKSKNIEYSSFAIENCIFMMYESALEIQEFGLSKKYLEAYKKYLSADVLSEPLVQIENKLLEIQISVSQKPTAGIINSFKAVVIDSKIKIEKEVSLEEMLTKPNLENIYRLFSSIYYKIFQHQPTVDYAQKLLDLIKRRLEVRNIRQSVGLSASITINQYKTEHDLIQQGLQLIEYLQSQNRKNYAITALQLMERDKSNQLYLSIQRSVRDNDNSIPESLKQLEITVEQQVKKYMTENISSHEKDNNKQDFIEIQRNYRTLVEQLVKKYPAYFLKKYNNNFFDFDKFKQSNEGEHYSFIEYFTTPSRIYCVSIDSNFKANFVPVEIKDPKRINEIFTALIKMVSTKPTDSQQNDIVNYLKLSNDVKKMLYDPIAKYLSHNIVIVPDVQLMNIPFEALCSSTVDHPTRWQDLSYLVENKNIGYLPSLKFLSTKRDSKTNSKKQLLGVAYSPPKHNEFKISPLNFAQKEISSIHKIFEGDTLLQNSSTFENIKKKVGEYNMLHLACHAKSDSLNGNESFIILNDHEKNVPEYVFAPSFYTLNLNNEMVVLSACQSALGQKYIGEGTIGLTRSFFYAGAKSVLSTLWNVADFQAGVILESFYKKLKENKSKTESLSDAKRAFISTSTGNFGHPFYWAPYQISGDQSAINSSSQNKLYYLILGAFSLLLFLFFSLRK